MTKTINREIWNRARSLFEAEGRKDRVWGDVSDDGETAFVFTERTDPSAPTRVPLSADERLPYIEKAEAEMKADKLKD